MELLLVVGLAAILIVGGIAAYSMVKRGADIGETTKLIHMIVHEARRLNKANGDYGPAGTNLEPLLIGSRSLPPRHINGNHIITPYSNENGAVILLATGDGQFSLQMALPPAHIPFIAQDFDPTRSPEITSLRVCETTIVKDQQMPNPAGLSAICGNGDNASVINFTLVTR